MAIVNLKSCKDSDEAEYQRKMREKYEKMSTKITVEFLFKVVDQLIINEKRETEAEARKDERRVIRNVIENIMYKPIPATQKTIEFMKYLYDE